MKDEFARLVEKNCAWKHGKEEGREEGREEEAAKARAEKEQIIRNLFAMKMTTADIAKVVNLPEEEIAKLRQ